MSETSNLITRIRALLAKANSTDNEFEAEAFLTKANELLEKHQLDASAVLEDSDDPIRIAVEGFRAAAKSPSWHKNLFMAVAGYYGATIAISTEIERNSNGNWQEVKVVELTGKLSGIETAKLMFPWIKAQCNEKGRALHALYPSMTASQHARRVGNALVSRIHRLMWDRRQEAPKTEAARNALVILDQVKAKFDEHYGDLPSARNAKVSTHRAAREAAESIGLHRQAGHEAQLRIGN